MTGRTETSLREFARQLGISDTAVRKGVKRGRLEKSLGKTAGGDTCIVDLELAKSEWNRSTRTGVGVRTENGSQGSHVPSVPTPVVAAVQQPDLKVDPDDDGGEPTTTSLYQAQLQSTLERARQLKLQNDVTEGRLIPIEDVRKEAFESDRIIRESILNIPARLSGELAAETDAGRVFTKLDAALRQALDSVADELLAAVNG